MEETSSFGQYPATKGKGWATIQSEAACIHVSIRCAT